MSALTTTEAQDLERLEAVVERGMETFVEVGLALAEIRDKRLYRADFSDFDTYCRERWGWSRRRSEQLIGGASVVSTMRTIVRTPEELPKNEAQARELVPVPAEHRPTVMKEAVEAAAPKPPTAQHVKEAAKPYIPMSERLERAKKAAERRAKKERHESAQEIADALTKKKVPEGGKVAATPEESPAKRDDELTDHPGAEPSNPADEGRGNPNARIPRPTPSHRFREFVRVAVTLEEPSAEEIAAFPANDLMLEHLERAHRVLGLILSHNGRSVAA